MLEDTVGEHVLREGLSSYLKKYKFANAVTNDLWREISEQWAKSATRRFNLTVQEMMDTWTLQMGYPLISFVQHNSTNIYSIKQERFLKTMRVWENVALILSSIEKCKNI